jgi:hypothetical protein
MKAGNEIPRKSGRVSQVLVDESKSTNRDDVEGHPALDVLVRPLLKLFFR